MFRFLSNWNILTQIDRGYIEAVPASGGLLISYYFSFRHLLIASLCAAGAVGALLSSRGGLSPMLIAELMGGVWVLTFGLNWLTATVRFTIFIERVLRETRV